MKVGDLVRIPKHEGYWWSEKVGIIESIRTRPECGYPEYRILVTPDHYVRFSDFEFVEIISESR